MAEGASPIHQTNFGPKGSEIHRSHLSGCVNEFQPSPNLVKILKSNLAACGETPSFGSALTPISCRHT